MPLSKSDYQVLDFRYRQPETSEGKSIYPCYEILVSGKNLSDYFAEYRDFVTPFGIGYKSLIDELGPIDIYLGKREPDTPWGAPFLICAECHDLGCGGVWGGIAFDEDQVTWHNFTDGTAGLRFVFERQQYVEALETLRSEIAARHRENLS